MLAFGFHGLYCPHSTCASLPLALRDVMVDIGLQPQLIKKMMSEKTGESFFRMRLRHFAERKISSEMLEIIQQR